MQQNTNEVASPDGCISISILAGIILAIGIFVRGASGNQMIQLCGSLAAAVVLLIYARQSRNTFPYMIFIFLGLPILVWVGYFVATDNFESYETFAKRFQIISFDGEQDKAESATSEPAQRTPVANEEDTATINQSTPSDETKPFIAPPNDPYEPILEKLGSFAADREEAKNSIPEDFIQWRLYLGILLAIQYAASLYITKNLGLMKSPLLTFVFVTLGLLTLFTDMTEWIYEGMVLPLLDAGTGGKVVVVILAGLSGLTGAGNILAFVMANLFYDNEVMTLCLLPSIVIAMPIMLMRLRKAVTIRVPPVDGWTFLLQWIVIIAIGGLSWYLIYITFQGPTSEDFASNLVAPTPIVTEVDSDENVQPTAVPIETNVAIIGRIAFTSGESGSRDVYLLSAEDNELHSVFNDETENYDPTWSPDGEQLAFVSLREGNGDIFAVSLEGLEVEQLTHNDTGQDYDPAWSPDGEKIVFVSERDGDKNLYIMNANGSNERRLTDADADDYDPAWSLDGTQIVFVSQRDGDGDIYVMDANGTNVERLTFNETGGDSHPIWSPDSTSIAFVSDRDGNQKIYIMNAEGKNQRRLSTLGGDDYDPVWSSDGEWILFAAERDGKSQIYVIAVASGEEQLLVDLEIPITDVVWLGEVQEDE